MRGKTYLSVLPLDVSDFGVRGLIVVEQVDQDRIGYGSGLRLGHIGRSLEESDNILALDASQE